MYKYFANEQTIGHRPAPDPGPECTGAGTSLLCNTNYNPYKAATQIYWQCTEGAQMIPPVATKRSESSYAWQGSNYKGPWTGLVGVEYTGIYYIYIYV